MIPEKCENCPLGKHVWTECNKAEKQPFTDPDGSSNYIPGPDCPYRELSRLREGLIEIRDSKYCQYEQAGGPRYGHGVADGHRYCANIARAALEGGEG